MSRWSLIQRQCRNQKDTSHEITLLYSTSNNLRALPWREVLGESLDKSNVSSIHMMDEEHSGGQQNLNNK